MEDVLDTLSSDGTSQEALSGIMCLNSKDLIVSYGSLMFQVNFVSGYDERTGLVLIHLI